MTLAQVVTPVPCQSVSSHLFCHNVVAILMITLVQDAISDDGHLIYIVLNVIDMV